MEETCSSTIIAAAALSIPHFVAWGQPTRLTRAGFGMVHKVLEFGRFRDLDEQKLYTLVREQQNQHFFALVVHFKDSWGKTFRRAPPDRQSRS